MESNGPLPLLVDDPNDAPGETATIVLAHGAGAGMDSPFMQTVAEGLARGGLRVVRFEFPYMRQARTDGRRRPPDGPRTLRAAWQAVIEAVGAENLFIGGKSMGGRVASTIADDAGVSGLVCLGYPFHPPGRPEKTRIAHLKLLSTPTLILQGTRDPFGTPEEVESYRLSASIRIRWIEDGDHSFRPRAKSGRTADQNLAESIEAILSFAAPRPGQRAARAAARRQTGPVPPAA